ncbi:hypothetical protein VULLAG_LOCUS14913 [Vulpes lagopus]
MRRANLLFLKHAAPSRAKFMVQESHCERLTSIQDVGQATSEGTTHYTFKYHEVFQYLSPKEMLKVAARGVSDAFHNPCV